jgi:aminopeptidase-like protein
MKPVTEVEERSDVITLPRIGEDAYRWASDLFPLCRSLTGPGVRETLRYLQELLPAMTVESVPTGTKVFDWTVPKEWSVRSATLTGPDGDIVADFATSNLHVVGYSVPVDRKLTLGQLQAHLHSLPDQPDAIPYVTSYYKERWGFCLPHRQRLALKPGTYHARIDSDLADGALNYGELRIAGECTDEVLLSTYVCHPSLANNELSGPVVTAALARWLAAGRRRYSYRILFIPETIGSIAYLSRHLDEMKRRTIAGYVVTCVGDDRTYSFLPSRNDGTLADRAGRAALAWHGRGHVAYSFLDRGSDERQYCSPGVDLPVASIMRSKYGTYPEYHTSLDDLSVISPEGLQGGFEAIAKALWIIEHNEVWRATMPCEPQLGRRGLYPTLSTKDSYEQVRTMMDVLAYADGTRDLIALSDRIGADIFLTQTIIARLAEYGLLDAVPEGGRA